MASNRRTIAHGYWQQQLTVLSLLLVPIHSLSLSLPTSQLTSASGDALEVSYPCGHSTSPRRISIMSRVAATGNNIHGGHKIHTNKERQYSFSLRAASNNEMEIDDDLDAFMDELFEESVAESASTEEIKVEASKKDSSHFIQGEAAVGIGGNDGFVYDVNALKRNLIQESVRGSKQELLVLLGDGRQNEAAANKATENGNKRADVTLRWRRERDDLIEERLSSLVQASPVSTTTDSNLLDGEWSFAFATNSASTILDTSRFLLSKTKRIDSPDNNGNVATVRGGPWRFRAGKTENPFRSSTRQIYLENLIGDENAHIIDETRLLGGLFQIRIRYDVYGLTRTALDLDMTESESKLFGFRVNGNNRDDFKGTKQGQPLEIQVLYLDNDLCICTTGAGLDGPLHVYTKSDSWVTGGAKRKLRLIAKSASWISTMQSPLRIRQRLLEAFNKKKDGPKKADPALKAVNIGEVDIINADGTTREDSSWDGPDDPFMHLSPGERMKVLRTMSLQDIYQSASERKEQNKKQKKKWGGKKSNKFKRPDI